MWALVRRQHGVISHRQLIGFGFSAKAITRRLESRRLHRLYRGVYAVGRPDVGDLGRAMAAVLACGPTALGSSLSASFLTGMTTVQPRAIHVSVVGTTLREHEGLVVHRRKRRSEGEAWAFEGIPITSPLWTLIDLAVELDDIELERAINEADKLKLIRVAALRAGLEGVGPQPGAGRLRRIIDIRTFVLTDSQLEVRFNRIARRAGLGKPLTGRWVDGFKVDFWWPDLDLVVETDGFGVHRTPSQMTRDAERFQAHVAAGRTALRFSHGQIRYEPERVTSVLGDTASRIERRLSG